MEDELRNKLASVIADSQKSAAADMDDYILKFFGDEATFNEFAHLYILEIHESPMYETAYNKDFSGEYKIRQTITYRLRQKTKQELATELATTSQELHAL